MGVIAKGIPRGCQGLFTPVSLGYPLSVFNKNSTLKQGGGCRGRRVLRRVGPHTNNARSTWMFSVFHHLQKDKQRKQCHSLVKLGKKRQE